MILHPLIKHHESTKETEEMETGRVGQAFAFRQTQRWCDEKALKGSITLLLNKNINIAYIEVLKRHLLISLPDIYQVALHLKFEKSRSACYQKLPYFMEMYQLIK